MHENHAHEGGHRGGPRSSDTAFDRRRGAGRGRGRGRGRGPGGRARRGDVRSALLVALLDAPAHGYELMKSIAAKSGGAWEPSPGAVYPSLEALLDEGLVTASDEDGRRVFTLTDAGREAAEERRDAGAPWEQNDGELDSRGRLRHEAHMLLGATKQVGMAGSTDQVDQAAAILADARKRLYELLAEG